MRHRASVRLLHSRPGMTPKNNSRSRRAIAPEVFGTPEPHGFTVRNRKALVSRSAAATPHEAQPRGHAADAIGTRARRGVKLRSCRIAVRHHWRTTLTGVVSGRHATRQQQNCRPDSWCWGSVNIWYNGRHDKPLRMDSQKLRVCGLLASPVWTPLQRGLSRRHHLPSQRPRRWITIRPSHLNNVGIDAPTAPLASLRHVPGCHICPC